MPRPKRTVRASGVGRSLGASKGHSLKCIGPCGRWLPRDAIAYIGRKPVEAGPNKGRPRAVCGKCWQAFLDGEW